MDGWAVETSKDGERWRFFGKAWKMPDEGAPLERNGDHPMSLLDMEQGMRRDSLARARAPRSPGRVAGRGGRKAGRVLAEPGRRTVDLHARVPRRS